MEDDYASMPSLPDIPNEDEEMEQWWSMLEDANQDENVPFGDDTDGILDW